MSRTGLFVPTYGRKLKIPKDDSKTLRSSSNRMLPSKIMPVKRSLLPPLVFNGKIEYIQTFDAADRAGRAIEAARPEVLGFDIEWQVSFVLGQASRRTATLQLCAPDQAKSAYNSSEGSSESAASLVRGTAFIFHLFHMGTDTCRAREAAGDIHAEGQEAAADDRGSAYTCCSSRKELTESGDGIQVAIADADDRTGMLPESLVRILSDPDVVLAGIGVGGDVCRLEKEYPQLRQHRVKGTVCLSEMAKRKVVPDKRRRGMWSLSDLCAEMLHFELRKPSNVRTSAWENRPLSVDQLFYAASDAYAGLRLWQVMQKMPNMVPRQTESSGSISAVCENRDHLEYQQHSTGDHMGAELPQAGKDGSAEGRVSAIAGRKPQSEITGERDRPSSSQRLSSSKLETHRLWYEDGLSVEAVAEIRCNKISTVLGYLSGDTLHFSPLLRALSGDCIEAGLPYAWERLNIDSDTEAEITRALQTVADKGLFEGDMAEGSSTASHVHYSTEATDSNIVPRSGLKAITVAKEDEEIYGCSSGSSVTIVQCATDGSPQDKGTGSHVRGQRESRWGSVRLKDVKALVPNADYSQIKLILARLKSSSGGICNV